ncbi:MAG: LON peptidase substrate-binding domain-containing protein [Myxococcales bacterium]|nr:LON peptidase substrate-binding domain-containing protein [Myxococcales bacterium]
MLLPGGMMPLHVFEPRYRELVESALGEDRVMAIATLRPGYEDDYEARPPVFPIMGAGTIVAAEKLEGGRWNVLLRGTDRVRLLDELPPMRAFREIRAERVPDVPVATGHALEHRLRSLIGQLADQAEDAAAALHLIASHAEDAAGLCNLIAAHACSDPHLRRRLLETVDVERRLELTCTHLGRLLLEVMRPPEGGTDTLH